MLQKKYSNKIYIMVLLVLATACKSYQPIQKNSTVVNLPKTFSGSTDTLTIATLPINRFFADKYLITLIDTALKANPDVLMALQKVEINRANLMYSQGKMLPAVSLAANIGVEKYGDYTQNGVGNFDTNLSQNINGNQRIPNPVPNYFVGFQSAWEVDLWHKLSSQKQAAYLRLLAGKSGYRLVTTTLVAQIAILYYNLLAFDNELAVIRKNIDLQEKAVEIVKIQKMGGRATELAVQQFEAQLLRTRALEFTTLQQITETENELQFLTGGYKGKIARDTSLIKNTLPPILEAGVPSQMLLNRPDIQAAELELSAMKADVHAARASFFPSLNLTPYAGLNSFNLGLLVNPSSFTYGLLGGITAPIFNRKGIKAEYAKALAEEKMALYNYQKSIYAGFMEVNNNLSAINNYKQALVFKQEELKSLNYALTIADDLYLVGRASYLEIISAQTNVLDAELQMAALKRDLFISSVNLFKAVGGGWQ